MRIGQVCSRDLVTCDRRTTVPEAARLMRTAHVGALVIAAEVAGARAPVGIVTDRDLVVEVLAAGLDPATLQVGDLIGPELVTAGMAEGVFEVLQRMHAAGVRRIPVVDDDGALVGIATADDILQYLAAELQQLSRLVSTEQAREQQARR